MTVARSGRRQSAALFFILPSPANDRTRRVPFLLSKRLFALPQFGIAVIHFRGYSPFLNHGKKTVRRHESGGHWKLPDGGGQAFAHFLQLRESLQIIQKGIPIIPFLVFALVRLFNNNHNMRIHTCQRTQNRKGCQLWKAYRPLFSAAAVAKASGSNKTLALTSA
jgi:hypothetical protein